MKKTKGGGEIPAKTMMRRETSDVQRWETSDRQDVSLSQSSKGKGRGKG
jgi:hypothetical protein